MQPSYPTGLLALVQIYYSIDLFTPSLANSTYCVCKEIHYSCGQTLFHYTSRENVPAFIAVLTCTDEYFFLYRGADHLVTITH